MAAYPMERLPGGMVPQGAMPFNATSSVPSHMTVPPAFDGVMRFSESPAVGIMHANTPGGVGRMVTKSGISQAAGSWKTRVDGCRLEGALFEQARLGFYVCIHNSFDKVISPTLFVTLDTIFNTLSYTREGVTIPQPRDILGQPVMPSAFISYEPPTQEESRELFNIVRKLFPLHANNRNNPNRAANIEHGIMMALGMRQASNIATNLSVCRIMTVGPFERHPREWFSVDARPGNEFETTVASMKRPLIANLWDVNACADMLRRMTSVLSFVGNVNSPGAAVSERNSYRAPISTVPDVVFKGQTSVCNYWFGCTNIEPLTNLWLVMHFVPIEPAGTAPDQLLVRDSLKHPAFVSQLFDMIVTNVGKTPAENDAYAAQYIAHTAIGLLTPRLALTPFANAAYPDPQLDPTFADVFMPNGMPCALLCIGQANGSDTPVACRTEPYGGHRSYAQDPSRRTAAGNPLPATRRPRGDTMGGDGSDRIGTYLRMTPSPDHMMCKWAVIYP